MNKFAELITLLKDKHLTLGSVESMTAGGFAFNVTSVSGASCAFKGSIVTYWSDLKTKIVNVRSEDIDTYGVVSDTVAKQMAIGGKDLLDVNICVSITGNAGPSKCIGQADVGDYYIGLATSNITKSFFFHDSGDRNSIRINAINNMIDVILKELMN